MPTVTVPGKVFLIGEYGALQGGKAVIAAIRPGYTYEVTLTSADEVPSSSSPEHSEPGGTLVKIHPDSPIGKYIRDRQISLTLQKLSSSMAPGSGSSTAELIAGVYADLERVPEGKRLWAWYRDQFPKTSGADLVVQLEAFRKKKALFTYEHGDASALTLSPDVSRGTHSIASKIHVFQVAESEKLPTHEALKNEIPKLDVAKLNSLVTQVANAFETNTLSELKAFSEFANILHDAGIETPMAREIRMVFAKLPGAIGAKGCGAGMHDVFVVAGDFKDLKALHQTARDFKLKSLGPLSELLW